MIRYTLACEAGHEFESWFPSAASYDEQAARGLVGCAVCGSPKVGKTVMAPAIGRAAASAPATPSPPVETKAGGEVSVPAPPSSEAVAAMTLLSEKERAVRAMLREVRRHVQENADYVGRGFADEARRMHYGEIEHRSIYGEADKVEAQALREEGIEVHPLPIVPDDRN